MACIPLSTVYAYMSLQLIIGSVYSGKSATLLQTTHLWSSIGMRCLVINHINDIPPSVQDSIVAIQTNELLLAPTMHYDAIAIDGAEFFSNLRIAVQLMVEKGKHVVVAGLNGDCKRQKIGEILDLVPYTDKVTFTRALCQTCGHPDRDASFTKRFDNVQGAEHTAVCRQCY